MSGFPIVGVGASAGGLAATSELLRLLGPVPGVSVVVVHHLEADHQSSLVDILSRSTTLPVDTVRDGVSVEPNHVYVVPPNTELTIRNHRLALAPRADSGLHLPIDRFFESLAADCGFRAIGVVLTGNGSDGTAGIKAIKADGGIAFAQDASAEYPSMPSSAVQSGAVDLVLPIVDIARELVRLGQRVDVPVVDEAPVLLRILAAMRKTSGIDFANYKHSTLRRRIQRRLTVSGADTLTAYADLVTATPAEARALCDEVLIHVTSFFRDPETFEALRATVYPRIVESHPAESCIRVWVPGCSTGEEVYSIAIGLLEVIGDQPIKVFGTDVSLGAIDKARAGKYPAAIERDVSPERLQRFFTKLDDGYQIRKEVRELCVFAKHDATRDPPFAGMDLISCRNVMIYLGPLLQERILPIFHYALKEPGFLVLGSAETIRAFPGFAVVDAKNRIYARTSAMPRVLFHFGEPLSPPDDSAKPGGQADVLREADRLVLGTFGPPGVVVTEDLAIIQFRGQTGAFLDPTPGLPTFDLLRMVREELRLALRQTLDEAREQETPARKTGVVVGPTLRTVSIEVIPFRVPALAQRFFVVLFRDLTLALPQLIENVETTVEAQLRQELASTRVYLQAVIEQLEASNEELKAANEEVVSSNEELRSTNEELQMAKEELQATNDELSNINAELSVRSVDATRLSDDLTNVLNSVEVPIVLLGRNSLIRRYTPAAATLFHLTPADVGRSMADAAGIESISPALDLPRMIAEVLLRLAPVEHTIQDQHGHWYQIIVRPYVTLDNRIDGTVITAFDVDAAKKAAQLLGETVLARTETRFREMLTTAAAAILMTDAVGRIVFANQKGALLFGYSMEELIGMSVDALVPDRFRKTHAGLRTGYMSDPSPRTIGTDRDLVGRRKDGSEFPLEIVLSPMRLESGSLVVSFISDTSRRRESDRKLRDYQDALRRMAFDATVAEDRERRRIAADLHDRIGQSLALAQIRLTSVRETVSGPPRSAIDQAIELLAQSVADTRTLIFELSPPVLYALGLKEALSWLVDEIEKRQPLKITISDDGVPKPLDDAAAAIVFRAVRELLMNVIKHAQSTTASVSLRCQSGHVDIEVEDPGVGFDAKATAGGFGLFSVREQIQRLGGQVDVVSAAHEGTRVSMRVPLKVETQA